MKRLVLVGALALCGALNAQMEKGSWIASGKTGIGFNSTTTKFSAEGNSIDGPKVSTFTLTPSVGYFAANNLAIGLDVNYTSTKTTFKNSELDVNFEQTQSTFSLLPNATYYFATGSNFRPYLGAGIGYGSTTSSEDLFEEGNEEVTTDGLVWGAKGGFVYLLNSSVGLDLGLGYTSFTNKRNIDNVDLKTTANSFGVSAGVSFFFK